MNNRQSPIWAAIGRGLMPIGLLVGALATVIGAAMAARPSSIPRFGGEQEMEARRRDVEYERRRGNIQPVERYDARPDVELAHEPAFHWSAVWTGVISGLAFFTILVALVISVGFATGFTGASAVVWGIIVAFIGFFGGGWVASATSDLRSRMDGWVLGSMIWALSTLFLVALGATGAFGFVNAISRGAAVSATNTQGLAIGTLILLVVTYLGSVVGALIGAGRSRTVDITRNQ